MRPRILRLKDILNVPCGAGNSNLVSGSFFGFGAFNASRFFLSWRGRGGTTTVGVTSWEQISPGAVSFFNLFILLDTSRRKG